MKTDFQNALMESYDPLIDKYDRLAGASTPHQFSDAFCQRMSIGLREHGVGGQSPVPTARHHSWRRVLLVAALIVVLLISTVSVLAMIYPDYFMTIKEKVTEWEIGFVRDKDAETDEDAPFVIRKVQTPAGFEIAEEHRQDTSYDVVYTDGKDPSHTIIYSQEQINEVSVVGLDAENDSMKHVDVNYPPLNSLTRI